MAQLGNHKHAFARATCGEDTAATGGRGGGSGGKSVGNHGKTGGAGGALPAGVARPAPAIALFQAALHPTNNPGEQDPRFDAEGGAATGTVVAFHRSVAAAGQWLVVGAALGDVAGARARACVCVRGVVVY